MSVLLQENNNLKESNIKSNEQIHIKTIKEYEIYEGEYIEYLSLDLLTMELSKYFVNTLLNEKENQIKFIKNQNLNVKVEYQEIINKVKEEYEERISKIKEMVSKIQSEINDKIYNELEEKEKEVECQSKKIEELEKKNYRLKYYNENEGNENFLENSNKNNELTQEIDQLKNILIVQERKINELTKKNDSFHKENTFLKANQIKQDEEMKVLISLLDDNKRVMSNLNNQIKKNKSNEEKLNGFIVEKDMMIRQVSSFIDSLKGEIKFKDGIISNWKNKYNKAEKEKETFTHEVNLLKSKLSTQVNLHEKNKNLYANAGQYTSQVNQNQISNYNYGNGNGNINTNAYNSLNYNYNQISKSIGNINSILPNINTPNNHIHVQTINNNENIKEKEEFDYSLIRSNDSDVKIKELSNMMKKILNQE